MAKITLEQLKQAEACYAQVKLFKQMFGEEVEVTPEKCLEVHDKFDWEWAAENLLTPSNWEEYNKICDSALEEYKKVRSSTLEKYYEVCGAAWKEHEKVRSSAWEELTKVLARTFGELYYNQ